MTLRTIVMIVLVAAATFSCAKLPGDWGTAKARAENAIDSGDCAGAWNVVWPWAQKGNIEARVCVVSAIKNGFVRDFEDYAREIDAYTSMPGT